MTDFFGFSLIMGTTGSAILVDLGTISPRLGQKITDFSLFQTILSRPGISLQIHLGALFPRFSDTNEPFFIFHDDSWLNEERNFDRFMEHFPTIFSRELPIFLDFH